MKISVITVSYNSAETIGDTVNSVAIQSHKNFEHIVIDGNSSDETLRVLELHRHPTLVVSSEPDRGIYDAMNKGLRIATGDIVGFLNSDDFYADSYVLEKISSVFLDETIEVCFADLVYVTQDDSRVARLWKSRPFKRGDFSKGWSPAHPTFYARKSTVEKNGIFDLDFKLASDVEFMMRYLECGGVKSSYIPHVLVRMRVGGATNKNFRNVMKQNQEIFKAFKKNKVRFNRLVFWTNKIFNRSCQYFTANLLKLNKGKS